MGSPATPAGPPGREGTQRAAQRSRLSLSYRLLRCTEQHQLAHLALGGGLLSRASVSCPLAIAQVSSHELVLRAPAAAGSRPAAAVCLESHQLSAPFRCLNRVSDARNAQLTLPCASLCLQRAAGCWAPCCEELVAERQRQREQPSVFLPAGAESLGMDLPDGKRGQRACRTLIVLGSGAAQLVPLLLLLTGASESWQWGCRGPHSRDAVPPG